MYASVSVYIVSDHNSIYIATVRIQQPDDNSIYNTYSSRKGSYSINNCNTRSMLVPIPCVHSASTVYDTLNSKVNYSIQKGFPIVKKRFQAAMVKKQSANKRPYIFQSTFSLSSTVPPVILMNNSFDQERNKIFFIFIG